LSNIGARLNVELMILGINKLWKKLTYIKSFRQNVVLLLSASTIAADGRQDGVYLPRTIKITYSQENFLIKLWFYVLPRQAYSGKVHIWFKYLNYLECRLSQICKFIIPGCHSDHTTPESAQMTVELVHIRSIFHNSLPDILYRPPHR
jgi:hypothetical protein